MITLEKIIESRRRIQSSIYRTPLEKSMHLSNKKQEVFLKLEAQQRLKSFKIRGALSKLTSLTKEERKRGVITVSSGNHGAGVSYGASLMGDVDATVVVPETTPLSKVEKIRYYGAKVIQRGQNYDGANQFAKELIRKEGLIFIDPCSDEDVIAGHGSMGLEILEDLENVETVLVPIGGGGMITGISVAIKSKHPKVRIVGVQTAACPAMVKSLEENIFYEEYPTEASLCDALVGGVGEIPYKLAQNTIDDILVVSEEAIKEATRHLLVKEKVVAEPSGAVGIAAIQEMSEKIPGVRVVSLISGGNLDEDLMKKLLK